MFGKKQQSEQPLYEFNYFGFPIKIYTTHIAFKPSGHTGTQSIPINQIAGVKLGMMGLLQITLRTTGGQKFTIPTNKKKEVQQAIYQALRRSTTPVMQQNNLSVADELAKLNSLKQQGIISDVEFENQKRRLLGS
jgi:hypothetical protein